MTVVIEKIRSIGKSQDCNCMNTVASYLSLNEYLISAEKIIAKFAPANFQTTLLKDEDAVSYVAYKMMRADSEYDASKEMKKGTWRIYKARMAIRKYLDLTCKAKNKEINNTSIFDLFDEPVYFDKQNREEEDEYKEILDVVLSKLTDSQRKCILLHYIDGKSPTQIGCELHVSRQSVTKTLCSAMKKLSKNKM